MENKTLTFMKFVVSWAYSSNKLHNEQHCLKTSDKKKNQDDFQLVILGGNKESSYVFKYPLGYIKLSLFP